MTAPHPQVDPDATAERLLDDAGAADGHYPGPLPQLPTRAEIIAHEQANDARLKALTAQYKVQFDQGAIAAVKLDHLMNVLFGEGDTPARLAFDASMAHRFTAEIDALQGAVARRVLTGPPSGLIIPPGAMAPRRGRPVRDNPQA